MISKLHRFHGYGSLRHVYRSGRMVRGSLFAVKVVDSPNRKDYRLAVVVSRKVDKSAVRRNKIRRRLYQATRQLDPPIKNSCDVVITVFQAETADKAYDALVSQLTQQLSAAGALTVQTKN